jgi:hypothetical protein
MVLLDRVRDAVLWKWYLGAEVEYSAGTLIWIAFAFIVLSAIVALFFKLLAALYSSFCK